MNKFMEVINDMIEIITGKRPEEDCCKQEKPCCKVTGEEIEEPAYVNIDKGFTPEQVKGWKELTYRQPTMKWTKKRIKGYMNDNKVKYNSGDTKADLLDKIKWNKQYENCNINLHVEKTKVN